MQLVPKLRLPNSYPSSGLGTHLREALLRPWARAVASTKQSFKKRRFPSWSLGTREWRGAWEPESGAELGNQSVARSLGTGRWSQSPLPIRSVPSATGRCVKSPSAAEQRTFSNRSTLFRDAAASSVSRCRCSVWSRSLMAGQRRIGRPTGRDSIQPIRGPIVPTISGNPGLRLLTGRIAVDKLCFVWLLPAQLP